MADSKQKARLPAETSIHNNAMNATFPVQSSQQANVGFLRRRAGTRHSGDGPKTADPSSQGERPELGSLAERQLSTSLLPEPD